jgi:hypothetical protein
VTVNMLVALTFILKSSPSERLIDSLSFTFKTIVHDAIGPDISEYLYY